MAQPISDDEATAFCLMLQAGLPPEEAMVYFLPEGAGKKDALELLAVFQSSKAVKKAQRAQLGKAWQELTLEERIKVALDQHYAGLAYLLFSTHYATATMGDKSKLDTARAALETKQAGMAGKTDALARFFDDLQTGRLKLNPVTLPAVRVN